MPVAIFMFLPWLIFRLYPLLVVQGGSSGSLEKTSPVPSTNAISGNSYSSGNNSASSNSRSTMTVNTSDSIVLNSDAKEVSGLRISNSIAQDSSNQGSFSSNNNSSSVANSQGRNSSSSETNNSSDAKITKNKKRDDSTLENTSDADME